MMSGQKSGFTIVELLIVVVVIGILAAITVVSYNGISQRARGASLQSSLSSMRNKVEIQKSFSGSEQYPGDLTFMEVPSSPVFQYAPDNTTKPYGYCLQATQGGVTYFITQDTSPASGSCDENFGLVAWWKLNNSVGDSGPKNWVTTNNGAVSASGQDGQANTAYSFSGTQSISANGFFTNGNSYGAVSISGWVYPQNNPTTTQGYFGVKGTTHPQYSIVQRSGTNILDCRIWTTDSASSVDAGTVNITPSAWNFVVLVYDGSSAQCYVNGVPGTATPVTGSFNFTATAFRMGTGFIGRLDDVRAYSRTLPAQEIQSMYTAGAK